MSKYKQGATQMMTKGGTLRWMPPEIMRELPYSGDKADAYSTGLVLYEILTGLLPFDGWSTVQLLRRVGERGERPPLHHEPRLTQLLEHPWAQSVATLVSHCWDQEPTRRPVMSTVLQMLEATSPTATRHVQPSLYPSAAV
mmetsp:Transcript_57150/g.124198  ORF Transcript_57150/g.124198 Transcript_57150/m.124198 type:complete len:141 (+) Transcript_57150:2-424(+)